MEVLFWIGAGLWFPSVVVVFVSRFFRRWESPVIQVGLVVSVIGAVLLAISTPLLFEDPTWKEVLYVMILVGWSVAGLTVVVAIRQIQAVRRTQE